MLDHVGSFERLIPIVSVPWISTLEEPLRCLQGSPLFGATFNQFIQESENPRFSIPGGAGKWAWFLPILATICDAKMTQYFHDQLLAFLVTHGITPDSMPMVRA